MDDLQPLKKANTGGLFPMDDATTVDAGVISEPATDNWHPQPLQKSDLNSLFPIEDSVTVVKAVETPIQRQRRLDGTPHTVGGPTALRPPGPKLKLDSLSKSYSMAERNSKPVKPNVDPDEVMKAYLEKHDQ